MLFDGCICLLAAVQTRFQGLVRMITQRAKPWLRVQLERPPNPGCMLSSLKAVRRYSICCLKTQLEPDNVLALCSLSNPAGHERRHVLVFDLGGGTFDTVLLERSQDLLQVCHQRQLVFFSSLQFERL